jgi:hypothetical protein
MVISQSGTLVFVRPKWHSFGMVDREANMVRIFVFIVVCFSTRLAFPQAYPMPTAPRGYYVVQFTVLGDPRLYYHAFWDITDARHDAQVLSHDQRIATVSLGFRRSGYPGPNGTTIRDQSSQSGSTYSGRSPGSAIDRRIQEGTSDIIVIRPKGGLAPPQ